MSIPAINLPIEMLRQRGHLGMLGDQDITGQARTRGFPSPSLGGFGFVVILSSFFIHLDLGNILFVNIT